MNEHVFQCGHPFSRTAQLKCLEEIRAWGKKLKIYPFMMSIILRHIHAWMRQTPLDTTKRLLEHNTIHQRLAKAIREYNDIGWARTLRDRLSKD